MNSLSLSQIAYAITTHRDKLDQLIKGDRFEPIWFEKLTNNPKKAKSFTGNFAVTFHFKSESGGKSKDYGIRLWHSKVKQDDLKRYRKLNKELEKLNRASPSYIRFAPMELFEPPQHGFLVKGVRHPCLRMEWQEAENLDIFIDRIMKDRSLKSTQKADYLRDIKQKIIETGELLHKQRCAHGDLSSGNLMLSQKKDGSIMIHIIDFDSFYSDELSNLAPSSIGHEDWQHPKYINGDLDLFGLPSDYCALLCLMITLESLATDPGLYDQFSPPAQDGSGILIRKKDLLTPEKSPLFKEIIDLNNSLLTSHLDDLFIFLKSTNERSIKRPKSLEITGSKVPRPAISSLISERKVSAQKKVKQKSWQIRKNIETEEDLINALESGATQMTIYKAIITKKFQKKFSPKSILRFYEIVIQHFGGLEASEEDIQTQYVWALRKGGDRQKSNDIAEILYEANPGNANIAQIIFTDLRREKKWKKLLEVTSKTLDLTPTNVNVNIFHSHAMMRTVKGLSVSEAFADSRVRCNDDWRILCEIINTSHYGKKSVEEDVIIECMELIMEASKEKDFQRMVTNKKDLLAHTILNYCLEIPSFTSDLSELLLKINPMTLRMCRQLPKTWEKKLTMFINHATQDLSMKTMKGKSHPEIYQLCEILGTLTMFGTGDPASILIQKMQKMVANFEWHSSDLLAIGLNFGPTNYPEEAMIVFTPQGWLHSKQRTPWEGTIGNIWEP